MTDTPRTDITIILDRSGSMGTISEDAIAGFNRFIDDQLAVSGTAKLTLVQFDDRHEILYDAVPLRDVPPLTHDTFKPRGATALHDAIGKSIQHIKTRLASTDPAEQPTQVIFVIITDGHENASHEFDRPLIADMIRHQREQGDWAFLFFGANQDAVKEADGLGIDRESAMTFESSGAGARKAFRTISQSISSFRRRRLQAELSSSDDRPTDSDST
ncbi:MAG TPA: vWA domain-containing protein [Planctomycetaceae bacterium]|nr:vWA domain-containing protein [Planctomycetaceae bacterium]